MNAQAIIRVISVTDTREYEEVGERWVPVAGSGIEHECCRCGRLHVVHAEVELSDGTRTIVGTGCAAHETMDIQGALRRGAAAAKRLAGLRAEHAALVAAAASYELIRAEVATLALPAVEFGGYVNGSTRHTIHHMGDVEVWSFEGQSQERCDCLARNWRHARENERGATHKARNAANYLEAVDAAIAKIERRMAA